jgi:hypothetical protein
LDELYERRGTAALLKIKSKAEVMQTINARSVQLQKVPSMTNQESQVMLEKLELKKQLLANAEMQLDRKLRKKQARSNKNITGNFQQMLRGATDFHRKQFFVDSNIEKKFTYFMTAGDKMQRELHLFNDGVVDSITKERE